MTEAALVDALLHALASAEPAWLEGVISQARSIDALRRRRDRRAQTDICP